MPKAARADDTHECHQVDGNHPHRGGPIEWSLRATVITGHRPQARVGDRCRCDGPPDLIVTGSSSVYVDGKLAARQGDRTAHPPAGAVTTGLDSVRIGGRREGAMLGGGVPSRRTCEKAASTRTSGRTKQSYGNCGVESVRQILNLRRPEPLSEDALLADVIAHGEAQSSTDPRHRGGATSDENRRTLERYGIPAREEEMSFDQIRLAVADGRGVITTHSTAILWGPGEVGRHAVLVTGFEYDDEGRLVSVVINDTGAGACVQHLDPTQFERSLVPGEAVVVTERPIW